MAMVHGDTVATGNTSLYAATHSPAQQLVALYGIPKGRIHTFTSYKKFKEDLQRCEDAFFSGAGKQYLAFGDVQQSSVRPIERGRSRPELPAFRFLYDAAEEVLIIKLMPGLAHESAAATFSWMFHDKLVSLGVGNTLRPSGQPDLEPRVEDQKKLTRRTVRLLGFWQLTGRPSLLR